MVKREPDGELVPRYINGCIFAYELWISGAPVRSFDHREGKQVLACQDEAPAKVHHDQHNTWWMYKGVLYKTGLSFELEAFSDEQLTMLASAEILEFEKKRTRRLTKAQAVLDARQREPTSKRESIPDDIKLIVWQRDGGKCVNCGSTQNLEYDHIIPISMGGSNTARNLQLLCQNCNRSKGGAIA